MLHEPLTRDIEPVNPQNAVAPEVLNRLSSCDVPTSLRDSPYFSSPIRPIPSFRSVSTRKSKRSTSRRRRSPARSKVGSLRLTSPYNESIFSLQSLNSTVSRNTFRDNKRSLNRSVLLPHEIDDVARFLGAKLEFKMEKTSGDGEDDDYEMSDFDDDSTVNSDSAISIDDAVVFEHISKKKDDMNLGNCRTSTLSMPLTTDGPPPKRTDESHTLYNEVDTNEGPQIKLPSVSIDDVGSSRKKRGNNGTSNKKSDSKLRNSPYATQTNLKKLKMKSLSSNKSSMVF